MEPNRREFIKQCAFQKFCNTVLHNEACDAHKELHRHAIQFYQETNIRLTLPEGMYREHISDIQDDFLLNDQQVGGIVLVDIPEELLDSPMKGLFEITELLRQQLMPDVPAEEVDIISWGGSQNAYMELAVGPEEIDYFHYLFRGTNNTYDVWFNWKLLNQDSDSQMSLHGKQIRFITTPIMEERSQWL